MKITEEEFKKELTPNPEIAKLSDEEIAILVEKMKQVTDKVLRSSKKWGWGIE